MGEPAFIFDAVRTPRSRGKADGSLHEVKPMVLAAGLLDALRQRNDLDTTYIDDVALGCVIPFGEQGSNIANAAVKFAGWSETVPGFQVDRFCASALDSVNIAAQKIASGWEHLVVAGGVESMSRVPMGANGGAMFFDPEFVLDQKTVPQGISADLIATLGGWRRHEVDGYAVLSQQRAANARSSGYFSKSIVPVHDENGLPILAEDDFIKPHTTMETLARLTPSFKAMGDAGMDELALSKYSWLDAIDHVHTPGNSSGIVDGASAVLIGSEKAARDLALTPRGRIVCTAVTSSEPILMLAGPAPAAKKCLAVAGLRAADIDLWEINEAFASVVLRYMHELDIDVETTNVNGGAIALGHPLGATGGMLVGTMLDELERRCLRRGMVSMCVGGGMGISTIIERL